MYNWSNPIGTFKRKESIRRLAEEGYNELLSEQAMPMPMPANREEALSKLFEISKSGEANLLNEAFFNHIEKFNNECDQTRIVDTGDEKVEIMNLLQY